MAHTGGWLVQIRFKCRVANLFALTLCGQKSALGEAAIGRWQGSFPVAEQATFDRDTYDAYRTVQPQILQHTRRFLLL